MQSFGIVAHYRPTGPSLVDETELWDEVSARVFGRFGRFGRFMV